MVCCRPGELSALVNERELGFHKVEISGQASLWGRPGRKKEERKKERGVGRGGGTKQKKNLLTKEQGGLSPCPPRSAAK